MSSYAFMRPPAVDPEATISPDAAQTNPLEEFAGLMGVDVSALECFRTAEAPVPAAAHEPAAAEMDSAPSLDEGDSAEDDPRGLLFETTHAPDLYPSAAEGAADWPALPRRSNAVTLGVLVALGLAGCLGAWAFKATSGPAKSLTMAAVDPVKAPPAMRDARALLADPASVAPADRAGKPAPVNAASIEKPASILEAQTKTPTLNSVAGAAPIAAEAAPAAAPSATRSIALLASAFEQTQTPTTAAAPRAAATASLEPSPVKTVSVRTDGSLLPSDGATPAASAPPPPASATSSDAAPLLNPPTPVARPSFDDSASDAPKPAKEKTPVGSALQIVPNAHEKAASAVRGSPPETRVAATDPAAPPPTATGAAAPSGGRFSADSVLGFVPNLFEKAANALRGSPAPTRVATADPKAATASVGGAYAVEFAAPTTEPAARRASARVESKYASELGGMQPTIRQAEVRGHKIYQVRIGGMSKADAETLCLKLKANGGEPGCSVARD